MREKGKERQVSNKKRVAVRCLLRKSSHQYFTTVEVVLPSELTICVTETSMALVPFLVLHTLKST